MGGSTSSALAASKSYVWKRPVIRPGNVIVPLKVSDRQSEEVVVGLECSLNPAPGFNNHQWFLYLLSSLNINVLNHQTSGHREHGGVLFLKVVVIVGAFIMTVDEGFRNALRISSL